MSTTERCDEIVRLIDEALGACERIGSLRAATALATPAGLGVTPVGDRPKPGPSVRFHPSLRTAGEIMAAREADAARSVDEVVTRELRTDVVVISVTTVKTRSPTAPSRG